MKVCYDLKNVLNSKNTDSFFALILDVLIEARETSLIKLVIEPFQKNTNDVFDNQLKDLRAQLRFNNIQMIHNTSQSNEETTDCEIQLSAEKFSNIEICRIPKDGNCLYGATVHQFYHLKIDSDEYNQRVGELRKQVVVHIKNNLNRYERQLSGRIYDKWNAKKQKPTAAAQITAEDFTEFLDKYLSKDCCWGGPESIQAISEIFKANVVVFNEWGDVNFGNCFDSSYESIISLAFRVSNPNIKKENIPNSQRNHYDSIVKLSNGVIDECTTVLLTNQSKFFAIQNSSNVIDIE